MSALEDGPGISDTWPRGTAYVLTGRSIRAAHADAETRLNPASRGVLLASYISRLRLKICTSANRTMRVTRERVRLGASEAGV